MNTAVAVTCGTRGVVLNRKLTSMLHCVNTSMQIESFVSSSLFILQVFYALILTTPS